MDRWIADAKAHERALTITAIPYSETRAYVQRVLTVRGSTAGPTPRSSASSRRGVLG